MADRAINLRVLPGEPLDGSGRICIHLFVQDERGSFIEPHALHPVFENGVQKVQAKPTRGRLACDPKRDPAPVTRGGVITVTPRTDDPRAVTCPRCMASDEYIKAMEVLTAIGAV